MRKALRDDLGFLIGVPGTQKTPPKSKKADLHEKQHQFLALKQLEALYGGAAGGGKTEALLADAAQYILSPKFKCLILRRTYTALNLPGSIMNRALEWFGREDWHADDKRFVFKSGAIIQFGYCDTEGDLERYKSAEFHRIYIDELTEWPEAWYTFFFSRIRRLMGSTIVPAMRSASNPDGLGAEWVRRRFKIPEGEIIHAPILATEHRVFLPARADDNPSLDLAQYELALSNLSPDRYQQLRYGRWLRAGEGIVYKHYSDSNNLIKEIPSFETRVARGWLYVIGIDYGFTDACAFSVLGWEPHSTTVYVVECYKHEHTIASAAAQIGKELERYYKPQRIVGDIGGLGKGYAEEARQRFALPVEPAEKTNKRGYIDLLNGALDRDELLIVEPTCKALRDEWLVLPWGKDRIKEAPGFENHCADATLYGWRAATAHFERAVPAALTPAQALQAEDDARRDRRRKQDPKLRDTTSFQNKISAWRNSSLGGKHGAR